jgi:hypothetical protein
MPLAKQKQEPWLFATNRRQTEAENETAVQIQRPNWLAQTQAKLNVASSPESQRPSETSMTLGEEFKARAAQAGARWARARGAMERGTQGQRTDANVDQPAK